jgi:rhodanese-related sulfurtransferase
MTRAFEGKNIRDLSPAVSTERAFEGQNIRDLDPSTVVVREEPSTARKLAYETTKDPSFSDDFAITMESYLPIATYFSKDTDRDEILDMESPDQRREYLYNKYKALKDNQYADVLKAEQLDPWAKTLASISGEILDPVSLVPFGHGIKWALGGSAVLGSAGDALDQYVETGEIDPERNLKIAAVSAVGGGLLYGAGRGIAKQYNKVKEKKLKAKKEDYDRAKVKIERINNVVHQAKARGVDNSELNQVILDETALTQDELIEAVAVAGDDLIIPTNSEAALGDLVSREGLDAISRLKFPILAKYFEPISNTLYKISPRLSGRLRDVERLTHEKIAQRLKKVKPFMKGFSELAQDKQILVTKYLGNQNYQAARKVFKEAGIDGDVVLKDVEEVLRGLGDEFESVGIMFERLNDYFPRSVKDVVKLRAKIGAENKSLLDEAKQIYADRKGIDVADIDEAAEAQILDSILANRPDLLPGGGFKSAKERKIPQITDDLLEDYEDPVTALQNYIRFATSNIEERAFFGRGKNGEYDLDADFIDKSVGQILTGEDISSIDLTTLKEIFKARFLAGKQGGAAWSRGARNLSYLTTIVNPFSALIQLGDVGTSMWINGIGDTMAELLNQVSRGNKKLTMKDLGLEDVMAEEFTNTGKWAVNMHNLFTYSGFRTMDRLGKNIFIGASLRKAQGLAKTKAGKAKLAKDHEDIFGDETDQLIADLESGEITDNVKKLIWDQLSDAQPISLSEMPLKWLQSPDGRVMYSLKTFALRQIGTGLKRTLNLYQKGVSQNDAGMKRQALKNLVAYFAIVPTANMTIDEVKDFFQYAKPLKGKFGIDVKLKDDTVLDKWSTSILKMFGASEYAWSLIKKGEVGKGVTSIFMPPVRSLDNTGKLIYSMFDKEAEELDTSVIKDLPIMGKVMYYWFGDGIEKEFDKNYKRKISRMQRGEE